VIPLPPALAPYTLLLKTGVVVALLAAAAAGGCTLRGVQADRDIAALKLEHATAVVEAEKRGRENGEKSAATADKLARLAQENTDALQATQAAIARSAAAADGTRVRLLDAWGKSAAARRCPDPGNPAAVAAAGASDVVRADVFGRAAGRATELARVVDEQHAYASSCAARFRQVSEELRVLRDSVK
jgi:hypothetical protein